MIRIYPLVFLGLVLCLWLVPATPAYPETVPGEKAQGEETAEEPAVKSATSPDPKAPKAPLGKEIRTLDEITIEGEIEVPQVLFITVRDRGRYHDHLHRLYLLSSLGLVRKTVFPMRLGTWVLPE